MPELNPEKVILSARKTAICEPSHVLDMRKKTETQFNESRLIEYTVLVIREEGEDPEEKKIKIRAIKEETDDEDTEVYGLDGLDPISHDFRDAVIEKIGDVLKAQGALYDKVDHGRPNETKQIAEGTLYKKADGSKMSYRAYVPHGDTLSDKEDIVLHIFEPPTNNP